MKNNKQNACVLLGLLVTLAYVSYFHRNPAGDDGWFAEQAFWLYKDGFVHSNFFKGVLGWDKQLFVSHKLFLLFNSGLIYLFGTKLPVFQLFGFIFFYVLIFQLYFYIIKIEKTYKSPYLLTLLIIIYSNYYLVKISFESRPEFLVAVMGFQSFILLRDSKSNNLRAALSGLLAGLATLTHLNGIIFLTTGFCSLMYLKQYKSTIIFSICGIFTSFFYFVDILHVNNGIYVWIYQFKNDPATQNAFTWQSKLILLLTFPKFFFLSPQQALYSTGILYVIFRLNKYIKNIPDFLKIYCAFLVVSFWLITKSLSVVYMPIFFPFVLIYAYELYRLNPIKDKIIKAFCVIYLCAGLYGISEIIYQNYKRGYLPDLYNNLIKELPLDESGFVPLSFFFNNYEKFPELISYDSYKFYTVFNHIKASPFNCADWANKNNIGFILIDYRLWDEPFFPEKANNKLLNYNLHYYDGRFAIYIKTKQSNIN